MERLLLEMVNAGHTDRDDKVWAPREILERCREAYRLINDFLNVTDETTQQNQGRINIV